MPMRLNVLLASVFSASCLMAGNWPQFRGPGGRSVAVGPEPPAVFGAQSNALWQVELPPGHSALFKQTHGLPIARRAPLDCCPKDKIF